MISKLTNLTSNLRLVSFIACVTFITKHNIEILTINRCKTLKLKWTSVTQPPLLTSHYQLSKA